MIRVLVVDDHAIVRSALVALLDGCDDIDVVGTANDGAQAVASYVAAAGGVDVVLMDLSMPGMDGVSATSAIMAEDAAARILVLTSFADRSLVDRAIDAGAIGYLLKDAEPDSIVAAVRDCAAGSSPIDARVAATLLRRGGPAPQVGLTQRELDVLRGVAEGLINKQIARRLGISEKTVKAHLSRVFQRLGVTDRTQAALWAERNRVFDSPR